MKDLVCAIDQGTTGTTVLLVDHSLEVVARGYSEFPQHYPRPGWVEHDPEEIWGSTSKALSQAISGGVEPGRIAAIGITNQRETTIVWDRRTGQPLHKAIVWQDRRTAPLCEALKKRGLEGKFRSRTGLILDPYFSGTKLHWLLNEVPGLKERALKGGAAFGTVDSYLVWRLTKGAAHVTDVTNASRTLLMNLKTCAWDPQLLKVLSIPETILPKICSSSEIYGETRGVGVLPDGIPVSGMAGDQQAALFGQACFEVGEAKCTYGTGSFMLMNTGSRPVPSRSRMLTTVAWKVRDKVTYALEGSAFIAGAAVQWLRDGLGIIKKSSEVEELAGKVSDTGGVSFVPALVGLGAPYWRSGARGLFTGINRGTMASHLARAVLEGIALLQHDIVRAMERDSRKKLKVLKVDGGASVDNLLMQFQADILGVILVRPRMVETTALGAAFLAGLAVGFWKDLEDIDIAWQEERRFRPSMPKEKVKEHLTRWQKALRLASA